MRLNLLIVLLALVSCSDLTEQQKLSTRLAPGRGEVVWRVGETNAHGTENRLCFGTPHDGGVIYWPSRRSISFTLGQSGQRKTLTGTFQPRVEHEVVFYWNQTSENMGLSIDGKPAKDFRVVPDTKAPLACPF